MMKNDALLGALVADAASMGLHWLYDQEQISRVEATGSLLFRQPDAAVYEGMRGAYVHAARRSGQLSHYGESARIAGKLALGEGYSVAAHQNALMAAFGPCGEFVGYADRPTKQLIAKLILEGDAVKNPSGMDDDQMPGVCVVPGLFSAGASESQLRDAVSVISTNDDVLQSASAVFSVLTQLQSGEELMQALTVAADAVTGELGQLMQKALTDNDDYRPLQAAQEFGLACYVKHSMPLSWYLLRHATDFTALVTDNIRCGGDCCGRSMALGAIAGLTLGVPDSLRQKVSGIDGLPL